MQDKVVASRVLIVGGAGYVGSTIANHLLRQGHVVMVFDDLSSGSKRRLPWENENLVFHEGSIIDPDSVLSAVEQFQPEIVYHMAAIHYIPQCINKPSTVVDINIQGLLNVVNALCTLSHKPKLIFTSSAAVYGADTAAPQKVNSIPQPCDIYGYSKMIGEHIVSSVYENFVIARLFNVFGDEDPIPHLIPSIVRQIHNSVIELGNPDSERDFIYVEDAARAFIALAEQGEVGKIYNIGSGLCFSVEYVANRIKKISGSEAKFVFRATERRKVDPKTLCADITEIVQDTNWRPSFSLDRGLKTVLNREHSKQDKTVTYSLK